VGGIDVISDVRALQKLAKVDPNPLRHLDTVLFPKLGVMMGVERTPKDCQVAVFAEGALGDQEPFDWKPMSTVPGLTY
jgi:hypothetical protein